MGNAAAVQSVAESSRRRLLLQQYNRQPRNVLVSNSLLQAFEQRRFQSLQPQSTHIFRQNNREINQFKPSKEPLKSLPLHDIHYVLTVDFGVQLTLEELPTVLRHLGCRVVESATATSSDTTDFYSLQGLVGYVAPRRVLRQVKRPLVCPYSSELSHNGVTIWQAAKMGNLEVLQAVCQAHHEAYRTLDDFENSPLYYASLCGREAAVDFVLRAYEGENRDIPPDELLRCITNALNQYIRALLQKKMTLEEVLKAQGSDDNDEEEDGEEGGAWFSLLADDDDE
ncbi:BTB/POZ domain-containing protein 3 [Phytophthora citrophthora]|uniref:BTB/POZ domain-containing protein 3 n=1 Tax=Phytophthora citrophthora TaxID=4793 RepID=A0AAD9GI76_9STRA|nr:BTB/POZ domain-containing protein 3 [Phytophthora citrophthora]